MKSFMTLNKEDQIRFNGGFAGEKEDYDFFSSTSRIGSLGSSGGSDNPMFRENHNFRDVGNVFND